MTNPSAAGPAPDPQERIDQLVTLIRSKQGELSSLKMIPDNRPYEDGSRLNLDIRIDNLQSEIQLLLDVKADLAAVRAQLTDGHVLHWERRALKAEAALTALRAQLEQRTAENPTCSGCDGPHPFDTSIPSVLWNRVIRAAGLPDYLCLTCIVRAFAKAGVSFTAELYGDDFNGLPIAIEVNGATSTAPFELNEENNRLRVELTALRAQLNQPEVTEAIFEERLQQVRKMRETGYGTDMATYWEGYEQGLLFYKSDLLRARLAVPLPQKSEDDQARVGPLKAGAADAAPAASRR